MLTRGEGGCGDLPQPLRRRGAQPCQNSPNLFEGGETYPAETSPSPSEGGEPKPAMRKYTMFVFVGMKYAVTYKLL